MLILSRNIGEAILIGDNINVTVSNVCGSQVRLAIDAPKEVSVDRAEIRARKLANPRPELAVDKDRVNQTAREGENVNQQSPENFPELTTGIPVVSDSMHIDDRVKMIGAEPAFMTVVFKLPSLNYAQALIDKLPYREKALGTEAEVFGYSAGNLMEEAPCEQ